MRIHVRLIRPLYAAAGHEVRPWLAKARARGLPASIARLGSAPGQTWLRLRWLSDACYAENASAVLPAGDLPVFVTVLRAQLPEPAALDAEISALTLAVAGAVARPAGRVHVQYAPAAAGRQAFGGQLVR